MLLPRRSLPESNDCPSSECLPANPGDQRFGRVSYMHCFIQGRVNQSRRHKYTCLSDTTSQLKTNLAFRYEFENQGIANKKPDGREKSGANTKPLFNGAIRFPSPGHARDSRATLVPRVVTRLSGGRRAPRLLFSLPARGGRASSDYLTARVPQQRLISARPGLQISWPGFVRRNSALGGMNPNLVEIGPDIPILSLSRPWRCLPANVPASEKNCGG